MKKLKILGFICLMSVGCSYNKYQLPDGTKFSRFQFGQETFFKGFEMQSGTNYNLKVSAGVNRTQPEVIEAIVKGAVAGAIGKP